MLLAQAVLPMGQAVDVATSIHCCWRTEYFSCGELQSCYGSTECVSSSWLVDFAVNRQDMTQPACKLTSSTWYTECMLDTLPALYRFSTVSWHYITCTHKLMK